jgi:hypothetical protein
MGLRVCCACGAAVFGLTSLASADVTLLTQQRSITAATTSNGNIQTVSAPDFAPFVQTLTVSDTFTGPTGPVTTSAGSRIDCQINPNSIRAFGSLSGAGGIRASTGTTEIGDAKAAILVTFQVVVPTPFNLVADPRPAVNPNDEFVIELKNLTLNDRIFRLESTDPAQAVDVSGILQPGQYSMSYRVEVTAGGSELIRNYSFNLTVPSPGAAVLPGLAGVCLLGRRRRN